MANVMSFNSGHFGWCDREKFRKRCESNILSTHIPLVLCQLALPFLRYSIFKLWPWKSKVKVIAQCHKEGIPPYRFISFSFHVNRPSHSWDTAILKFDIENSRSRSWVRSKFKVTTWVQHSVDSHPFGSMLIGPPIPEIQHFQTLTLKIQGQGHSSRSQRRYTTLSIHIPFIPCGSGIPFLSYDFFENLTLKIKGQGHGWGQVQSHNVGLTSYGFTSLSFHVNRPSHSWDTVFSKFDLENQGSRSWVKSQFKVTMWV